MSRVPEQRLDGGVEVAMFLRQFGQLGTQCDFVGSGDFAGHVTFSWSGRRFRPNA